eukprot:13497856-Ditylum_brightwellii.AAC.1
MVNPMEDYPGPIQSHNNHPTLRKLAKPNQSSTVEPSSPTMESKELLPTYQMFIQRGKRKPTRTNYGCIHTSTQATNARPPFFPETNPRMGTTTNQHDDAMAKAKHT